MTGTMNGQMSAEGNAVAQFYNEDRHVEWERLDRHQTEFDVTMRALAEFLPNAPAKILDIGGGPGRYAIALAQQGYEVALLDLAEENVVRAAKHATAANIRLADIQVGNALDLSPFPNDAYDAVLFLGPLYHLTNEQDRSKAVREALRVLKPNGRVFAAFLTRYSAIRICAERFPQWLFENQAYADQVLTTGIHQVEWGFTTTYYAEAGEVTPFMEANGFSTLQLVSSEGVVAHNEDRLNELTGEARDWWADLNYRLGKNSDLHGAATHLLYIGEKP